MSPRSTAALIAATIVALACAVSVAPAQPADEHDVSVTVRMSGETIIVDTNVFIAAPPEIVWGVLTDFEHMTAIVSNLQSSRVVSQSADKWLVAQTGKANWGPFSFAFDTVREVQLKPMTEIRSHLVSGTLKKQEGVTRITPQGAGTRLVSHAELIPDVWVAPVVGTRFIESETRKQIEELRAEMARRVARGGAPAARQEPAERTSASRLAFR